MTLVFKSLRGTQLIALGFFGIAFLVAPLAFGGTTRVTSWWIHIILLVASLSWLLDRLLVQRLPKYSWFCASLVLALGLLGASHYGNPRAIHDSETWQFIFRASYHPWLPGSLNAASTGPVVWRLAVLGFSLLALMDLSVDHRARWILLRMVAASTLVIAIVGIVQKAEGAEAMLWATPEQSGTVFFGAFRYHANAASFLNLGWPAALAVWMRSYGRRPQSMRTSVDFCTLAICLVAVFVNSSKAGHFLGLIGILIAAGCFWRHVWPFGASKRVLALLGLLLLAIFVIAVLPVFSRTLERWDQLLASDGLSNGRITAYRCCLTILPDSGWFGTGPGTFRLVFPYYTAPFEDLGSGVWTHAHQDYLQGLIEWGYIGFLLWLMLFGGALVGGIRHLQASRKSGQVDLSTSVAMLALSLLLLHALVDFPLQIPSIQYLVVLYLALLWSAGRKSRPSSKGQKKPPSRKGGSVVNESGAMTKSNGERDDLAGDGKVQVSAFEVPGAVIGFSWEDKPVLPSK